MCAAVFHALSVGEDPKAFSAGKSTALHLQAEDPWRADDDEVDFRPGFSIVN